MSEQIRASTIWCAQEGRFVLRLIGRWLLPWARIADFLAPRIVLPRQLHECIDQWWLSVCILSILVAMQLTVLLLLAYFLQYPGGFSPPCVCEATVWSPSQKATVIIMKTGSILVDFVFLLRACFVVVLSALNLILGILDNVWQRPLLTSLGSLAFLAIRTLV